jgi:fumarylacetoacetase
MASWLPGVSPLSDFSLANIPFGIITTPADPEPHMAVAIGSSVLDLKVLSQHDGFNKIFPGLADNGDVCSQHTLNSFASLGRSVHREVRESIQNLLSVETTQAGFLRDNAELQARAIIPQKDVTMCLPMHIGDYTDFYAGYYHAHAVGVMFRGPERALQPNYTHLPIGYHGRASSIVVSGTPVYRPTGQILLGPVTDTNQPVTGPCRRLDIELELGCFIAKPNELGESVSVVDAEEHIFGYVLLNDWSARDIQTWEYVPLGPFNGKNFASTISPWVVLADALEPYRALGIPNKTPLQDYLKETNQAKGNVFDIQLEIDLTSKQGPITILTHPRLTANEVLQPPVEAQRPSAGPAPGTSCGPSHR